VARFSYTQFADAQGTAFSRPIVQIRLSYASREIAADALLDRGSDVNVLPYQTGLDLGANWDYAKPFPALSGNLSQSEARAIILDATIKSLNPVRMIFIWLKTDSARLLLGQINFFQEFKACFYAFTGHFEFDQIT